MFICPELFRLILPCLGLSLCCVEIGLVIMTPSPTPLSEISQVVCNRNMCIPDNSSDETSTIANVSTAKKPAIKKLIKFCKKKFVLVPPPTISIHRSISGLSVITIACAQKQAPVQRHLAIPELHMLHFWQSEACQNIITNIFIGTGNYKIPIWVMSCIHIYANYINTYHKKLFQPKNFMRCTISFLLFAPG